MSKDLAKASNGATASRAVAYVENSTWQGSASDIIDASGSSYCGMYTQGPDGNTYEQWYAYVNFALHNISFIILTYSSIVTSAVSQYFNTLSFS